ncbi:hypothetical protein I3760_13G023600 [Carya illinoinensis]|nr:hypothetical protein I3760_13G023600 [Carya illinoinensis]
MLRYANNSNYKNDTMIRKQVYVTSAVLNECRRIILESEMLKEDDNQWPERDRIGRQELQIVMGNEHISLLLRRLVPSLMSRAVMTLKGVAYSITSFRSASMHCDVPTFHMVAILESGRLGNFLIWKVICSIGRTLKSTAK